MSCLAIIPARGGSVGLPNKNLRKFFGVPLVRLAVEIAKAVPEVDDFVVSTNREVIAAASGTFHIVKRPEELSTGFAGDVAVWSHALLRYEEITGKQFDEVVALQPTSPLRTPEDVSRAIQWRREGNWDSVWTVAPTDLKWHPDKQLSIVDGGKLAFWSGRDIIARQHLVPTYTRNGVAYVLTRDCLLVQKKTLTPNSSFVVTDTPQISIDTEQDLEHAEFLYKQQREKYGEQEGCGCGLHVEECADTGADAGHRVLPT